MWISRNKTDLIIEVWEKLDCENVGALELEAIETVVADQYGEAAVDSPMMLARHLADEGAELRHSEIMELHLKRAADRPYDAALRNILRLEDLGSALASIRNLENLRQKYKTANDREGQRLVRQTAITGKDMTMKTAVGGPDATGRDMQNEIAEWLTVWLQTPELFENWLVLRRQSRDFVDRFGRIKEA